MRELHVNLPDRQLVITDEDLSWFYRTHDGEGWKDEECYRCGGEGFVEYNDSPDLWGEDCPSEENRLMPCPECRQRHRDRIRIIVRHKLISEKLQTGLPKGAIFSDGGRYRYALWRTWSPSKPPLLFIGLNPSRADSMMDDPTVTRCMARATREGFGGLLVGNLFAFVSTDPKALAGGADKTGDENDDYLSAMIFMAGRVLCGWGAFPEAERRAAAVLQMIPEPYCLGLTAAGSPKHPLYIPYTTKLVPMTGKEGG